MTDKEIIKALEYWIKNFDGKATDYITLCNALDLINRLKCEVIHYRRKAQNQKQELRRLNAKLKDLKIVNEHLVTFNIEAQAEIERLNRLVIKEHDKKRIISEIFTRVKKYSFEDTRMKEGGGIEKVNMVFRDDVNKCLQDFLREWLGDIE